MKIKVKDKEFSFEGYVFPINSVQRVAERCYEQGAKDFAEVIKSRSSEMVQALIDRQLAEWQKGAE